MDLIAGDAREILLALGVDEWRGLEDRARFAAHLPLGCGPDPEWLDLFAQAAREATGKDQPGPLRESTFLLSGRLASFSERMVERVDPRWTDAVARLPDSLVDRIAARWVELLDCQGCEVDAEDKSMLRELAAQLVDFCRRAEGAEDVLFSWSI